MLRQMLDKVAIRFRDVYNVTVMTSKRSSMGFVLHGVIDGAMIEGICDKLELKVKLLGWPREKELSIIRKVKESQYMGIIRSLK